MRQAMWRILLAQAVIDLRGADALGRPEGVGVPLGSIVVIDRDEGRFAAHRQANVTALQLGVDLVAQPLDRQPLPIVVGKGHSWSFPAALNPHVVFEAAFAFLCEASDRCRRRRLRRAGQRYVPLAGEQTRGWVEADPSGPGQVHLAPGVQVGEVMVGPRGTVERLDVRHELDQVPGHEAGGQPEMTQQLHQQPRGVAA
ncbi:MAG: hypothetical protein AW12_01345 [Candidatus Accumulibacter sp. BA-94]|nr:MAG: hypothetical protein AW12_01345 [Candidatus Accumulibacter sp. BA-94]